MKQAFIDTNIVVYANDGRVKAKQDRAIEIVTRLMRSRSGVVSIQVLQEYANTALSKLGQKPDAVLRQMRIMEALRLVSPSPDMIRRQVEIRETYRIGFWDAGIVAAAEEARCDVILSEDLNDGQFYAGVPVANPFGKDFNLDMLA